MRRLTRLRTMRRLWCDASVAVSEVGLGLERGRHGGKYNAKARAAERGLGRCSYARERSRAVREGFFSQTKFRCSLWPPSRPSAVDETPVVSPTGLNEYLDRGFLLQTADGIDNTRRASKKMKNALSALFGKAPTADRGRQDSPRDARHAADTAGSADDRRTPTEAAALREMSMPLPSDSPATAAALRSMSSTTLESLAESPPTE